MESIDLHKIIAGKYILAVSGGVDSVVLLDLLGKEKNLKLVVAHVDHGIRPDSADDARFVKKLAEIYNTTFESARFDLGANASENLARRKRYEFFNEVKQKHGARSIITAHHQDDVIETAIINLIRGTGFWGLASLKTNDNLIRPLLHVTKDQIIRYAKINGLDWRDDSTNQDTAYLRNKIRHRVLSVMSENQRSNFVRIINKQRQLNAIIDKELNLLLKQGLHKGQPVLGRSWFSRLPHCISTEIIRKLLIQNGAQELDRNTIERVTIGLKTLAAGKEIQANGVIINLTKRSARLKNNSKTDKKKV